MAVTPIVNTVVGQYLSREASYELTSLTGTTQDFPLEGITEITGIKCFSALDSGNNYASDGADLTWSGNVLTVADGTGYVHSAMTTIWVTVFCKRIV